MTKRVEGPAGRRTGREVQCGVYPPAASTPLPLGLKDERTLIVEPEREEAEEKSGPQFMRRFDDPSEDGFDRFCGLDVCFFFF